MKILLPDGIEEQIGLFTRQTNDVFEFLKTKVSPEAVK